MCGILFYYGDEKISVELFRQALDLQSHRGPDHTGIYLDTSERADNENVYLENYEIALKKNISHSNFFVGHKRLAVFDLSDRSNQPFINNNKDFLIYNGEFYNYKSYASFENINSDGLTLNECLINFGLQFFNKVNGMWASINSDTKNNKIYLSRDRYGKKPLYYYLDQTCFVASSEIKSIFHILGKKRKINIKSLAHFFSYKISPFFTNGDTFYNDINSILPGSVFSFDLISKKLDKVFDIDHLSSEKNNLFFQNEDKLKQQFKYEFKDAVDLRLKTDRKVALLLSGGVDSSLIAANVDNQDLTNLNFYTIFNENNMENDYDLYYSRKISNILGVQLTEIPLSYNFKKYDGIFKTLTKQQEIPVNFSATSIPTYCISKQMNDDGIHVALDGVGGDEIMGGFPVYTSLAISSLKNNKFFKSLIYYYQFNKYENSNFMNRIKVLLYIIYKGLINRSSLLPYQRNSLSLMEYIGNKFLREWINRLTLNYKREELFDQLDRQIYEILQGGVPYYLGVSDSANMINTVESRSPFLDSRLNKYIYMPDHLKFRNGFNKYLLRESLESKFPKEISWRRQKQGFTSYGSENYILEKENIEKTFDSNLVRELLDKSVSINDILKNRYALRHLIPLATLDHIYDLAI